VGVLKALCTGATWMTDHRPLVPGVVTGTSIGSFNAAFLVSHWERHGPNAALRLEKVWTQRLATATPDCGNGIYRFLADPLSLLDPCCYVDNPIGPPLRFAWDSVGLAWDGLERTVKFLTQRGESIWERGLELVNLSGLVSRHPWVDVLHEEIDYAAIRRSPLQLRIAVINWSTGELRIFANHEMTDQLGPRILLASSAVPGFFATVTMGAQPFADGGVLLNTPLKPAIDAGADVIHMVYMDPAISRIPLPEESNTFDTLFRMQQIQWASGINDDVGDAEAINDGLALLARLGGGGGDLSTGELKVFIRVARRIYDRMARGTPYRPLTIYRYHPRDVLGGSLGFFNMRRRFIEETLYRGYQDAVHHSCDESGDVLPDVRDRARAEAARSRMPA
jgi:predicted acylesterase/phospholipase RssA